MKEFCSMKTPGENSITMYFISPLVLFGIALTSTDISKRYGAMIRDKH